MSQKPEKHVLIVEDDSDWQARICKLVEQVAVEYGWVITPIIVDSSDIAIEKISIESIDFIIVDNLLRDGEKAREILQHASKNSRKNTPIAVVSGSANPKDVRDFLKDYAADEFFWKGDFDSTTFKRVVADRMPVTGLLTWLHLSDLHIGRNEHNKDWRSLSKALLEDIKEHQKTPDKQAGRYAGVTLQPDFIFVTGDVANRGSEEEYIEAERLLKSIWEITGLGKEQTFVVPGNHDVNRNSVANDPVYESAYKEMASRAIDQQEWMAAVYKWWTSPPLRTLIQQKFKHYSAFIDRCAANAAEGLFYAKTVRAAGTNIGILGLNSAVMSWRDGEDLERGLWIGKPQLDEIEEAMSRKAQLWITLVHHPYEALHSQDDAWDRLQKKSSILLHGHLHKFKAVSMGEPEREHILLPAGSVNEGGIFKSQHYSYGRLNLGTDELDLYLRMTVPGAYPSYIRDIQTYMNSAADGHLRLHLLNKSMS